MAAIALYRSSYLIFLGCYIVADVKTDSCILTADSVL